MNVVHSKPNSSSSAFSIAFSTEARAPVVSNTTLPLLTWVHASAYPSPRQTDNSRLIRTRRLPRLTARRNAIWTVMRSNCTGGAPGLLVHHQWRGCLTNRLVSAAYSAQSRRRTKAPASAGLTVEPVRVDRAYDWESALTGVRTPKSLGEHAMDALRSSG